MKTIGFGHECAEKMHDEKLIFISQMDAMADLIDNKIREHAEADTKRILYEFVGWLSIAIPELHSVELPKIGDEVAKFLARRAATEEEK